VADVQLENGYTRIANELLEAVTRYPFNATQLKIILVLWRFTYGFSRKEHDISETFLLKALNFKKTQLRQLKRELKSLIEANVIHIVREASPITSRILAFNKNYEQWCLKRHQVTKKTPGDELDTTQVSKKTPPMSTHFESKNGLEPSNINGLDGVVTKKTPGDELDTQEIKYLNKNIKKMSIDDFFEQLWSLYPRKRGKGQVSKAQKERLFRIGLDELTRAIERYKQEIAGKDEQYVMYGSTFFNSGYIDFLDTNYKDKTEPKPNAEYLRLKEMVNGGQSAGV
jgi:phage replication O-like protein O